MQAVFVVGKLLIVYDKTKARLIKRLRVREKCEYNENFRHITWVIKWYTYVKVDSFWDVDINMEKYFLLYTEY